MPLVPPLRAIDSIPPTDDSPFDEDLAALSAAFRAQKYRSFCGPASLATVLRAYGSEHADQSELFDSVASELRVFYGGMTLDELAALAARNGLHGTLVHADELSLPEFRERLKDNLARRGDYVLVNYHRQALRQSGAGHISAVGAYDSALDAFLVLDQASYRYPFTWIPASMLYNAVRTRDGDQYRGIFIVHDFTPPPNGG